MKLISCHIDNFGCLSNYTREFTPGLNVILAPNGFGKSTLAAFLRTMFYGFPRANPKGSLEKNPRKKYTPWQGGTFGGWVCFEAEGHTYQLHRGFSHTPGGDTFRLLEGGKPSDRFGTAIGQELFGIDPESFDRCLYLPQGGTDTFATGDIHARLTALIYNTDDAQHYENAIKRLQSRRTAYRHYRGSGGLIAAEQEQVYRLERELALTRQARQEYARLEEQLGALEQLHRQKLEQCPLPEEGTDRKLRQLEQRLAQYREALDALEAKYPQGLPDEEQLTALRRRQHRLRSLRQQLEQLPPQEDTLPPGMSRAFRQLSDPRGSLLSCSTRLEKLEALENAPKTKTRRGLLMALSLGLLAAGAALCLWNWLPGCLVLGGGLAVGLSALLTRKSVPQDPRKHQLQEAVDAFLASFPGDYASRREKLALLRASYPTFAAQEEERSYRESLEAQLEQLQAEAVPELAQLEEDAAGFEAALTQWEQCRSDLAAARREAGLREQTGQAMRRELAELETQLVTLRRRQALLSQQLEGEGALETQLENARQQLGAYQRSCDLLDKAMQLLEQAKDGLSSSYREQVQTHFQGYARQLLGLEQTRLETDLTPSIENRELGCFSPGIADGVRLCMHLALTDSLFPGEKPPLILDDPFVNLDAENLARAREILCRAAQSRQLLHLTCHESRA